MDNRDTEKRYETLGLFKSPYPRRAYGLVDFRELDFRLEGDARREWVAQIYASKPAIEILLRTLIGRQVEEWSRGDMRDDVKKLIYHDGGMNSYDLIMESLEMLSGEHIDNTKVEPEVDATLPPLSSGSQIDII